MVRLILLGLLLVARCVHSFDEPHFIGNRKVIVQLFEWRFDDIADECERFLGPYGYGAVQVSPILEYTKITDPVPRPWWERYQPVSYKIASRSGSVDDLMSMIARCHRAGVRIIIDLVINHMSGPQAGTGVAGTPYDGNRWDYPGVPFTAANFNRDKCGTRSGGIEDDNDSRQPRDCELVGLRDLDHSQEYVREKIADAMNSLIDLGVAGFRVDASKHMWPADLAKIFEKLHTLNTTYFPADAKPFLYHEVSSVGHKGIQAEEYHSIGNVIDFRFQDKLKKIFFKHDHVLAGLKTFATSWGLQDAKKAIAIVDNHDIQREQVYNGINFRASRLHKMATAFMLAWTHGIPKVMSSYDWETKMNGHKDENNWIGPPADEDYNIKRIVINDHICEDRWVCEHRWRQIYNMVRFHNQVEDKPVSHWWDNAYQQIAFGRGNKGFIAINNEDFDLNQQLKTGLPAGRYCDVISGNIHGNQCSGRIVEVDSNGMAHILVKHTWEDPMIAIHVGAKMP